MLVIRAGCKYCFVCLLKKGTRDLALTADFLQRNEHHGSSRADAEIERRIGFIFGVVTLYNQTIMLHIFARIPRFPCSSIYSTHIASEVMWVDKIEALTWEPRVSFFCASRLREDCQVIRR